MKVAGKHYRSIWPGARQDAVHIIDQSRLPHVFETLELGDVDVAADAIRWMKVRGAPQIGVTAAFGFALAFAKDAYDASMAAASRLLRATRPTAVNLAWAMGRMHEKLK